MSQEHLKLPQWPSTAGPGSPQNDVDEGVYEVGAIAASFGFFGLIWLDGSLVVQRSFGWLVDFAASGRPITESVLAFVGLENEILKLRDEPDRVLELPAIAVAQPEIRSIKLNFTIFWSGRHNGPIILAYRSTSQTELEIELSKQIRARLMAEAEALSASKELARANADLESFAVIISHDLKAPLRHMRILAEAALTNAETVDLDGIKGRLGEISNQAKRLSRMLSELFDYSSIGRKQTAVEVVETRALAEAIVSRFPRAGIRILLEGDWPTIETLRAPLDVALRNLVSNALQHHDLDQGHVWLTAKVQTGGYLFEVRDDGPGILPIHHQSIFLPFRTLSSSDKVGSTGMGLAMVKKTVESCGGTITVVSDPNVGRGSAFTLFWPKNLTF